MLLLLGGLALTASNKDMSLQRAPVAPDYSKIIIIIIIVVIIIICHILNRWVALCYTTQKNLKYLTEHYTCERYKDTTFTTVCENLL